MILATIKQISQKQLILVQGEDSKKGQRIYLTQKGSFKVILYKMIRFLSGKLKKHTKLTKIVKISIFVNRLVFPMNFNRFSHPMTLSIIYSHMFTKSNTTGQALSKCRVRTLPYMSHNLISLRMGTVRVT